jgi:hypothetical protein
MSTFVFLLCNEGNQYAYVESGEETLLPGETWAFSSSTGQLLCGTVVQQSTAEFPNFSAATQYEGCGDCLSAITLYFTANTIENICLILCDDPATGGTVATSVAAPHPTWTDNYGNVVVQGNAVLLGGNGLNS